MAKQWLKLRAGTRVPTLPVVAARILSLCQEEEYATEDLVQVLRTDPAISSRVLRLSNSAYYGFWRRIASLHEAVVLLGRVTVEALALGTSIFRTWRGKRVPEEAEALWVHAYVCAIGCEYLGERLPQERWRSSAQTLFMTGLLHDLGKLLFLAQEPHAYLSDILEAYSGEDLLRREQHRFGCDHAEAGAETMEMWEFPPRISALTRFHHGDGLREELRPDWEVLRTVDGLLNGQADEEGCLPPGLIADLRISLASAAEEARALYRQIL